MPPNPEMYSEEENGKIRFKFYFRLKIRRSDPSGAPPSGGKPSNAGNDSQFCSQRNFGGLTNKLNDWYYNKVQRLKLWHYKYEF